MIIFTRPCLFYLKPPKTAYKVSLLGSSVPNPRIIRLAVWPYRELFENHEQIYDEMKPEIWHIKRVISLVKRTQDSLDSMQVLAVIENYSKALDLLDDYDHQSLSRPVGREIMFGDIEGLGFQ